MARARASGLVAEKAAIRSWVCERRKPYLGICLGHQLLADALSGTVRKMDVPEMGVCQVTLNPAGASVPLFRDLPLVLPVLQWHEAAVERVPDGAVVLASNAHYALQSFSFADIAYGVQYHMEANRVHDPGTEPDSTRFLNIGNRSGRSPKQMVRGV